jgi:hypothetical protein
MFSLCHSNSKQIYFYYVRINTVIIHNKKLLNLLINVQQTIFFFYLDPHSCFNLNKKTKIFFQTIVRY